MMTTFTYINLFRITATTPPGRTEQFVNTAESNTVVLVVVLILGVALIFICFALVAVCYRYSARIYTYIHALCILQCLCFVHVYFIYTVYININICLLSMLEVLYSVATMGHKPIGLYM